MKLKDMAMIASAILMIAVAVLFNKNFDTAIIGWIVSLTPIALYYFWTNYKKEKRKEALEKDLVKKLFSIIPLVETKTVDEIIEYLADESPAGKQFKVMSNQIKTGVDLEDASKSIKKRAGNKYFSQVMDVFLNYSTTGSIDSKIVLDIAEQINSRKIIDQERKINTLIQKYTLMASVVFAPLIIGSMLYMIKGLDFSSLADIGLQTSNVVSIPSLFYVGSNALITSIFLGNLEDSKFKIYLYMIIFIPLSIVLFNLAFSGKIIGAI